MMKQVGEDLKKVSMNFPRGLWTRLKVMAAEEETTVTDIVLRLCRKHLSKGKKKGKR